MPGNFFIFYRFLSQIDGLKCVCLQTSQVAQLVRSEEVRLLELEHEDMDLREQEEELRESTRHWIAQLVMLSRPFQLSTGIVGLFIGGLIYSSLFMTKSVIAILN